MKQVKLETKSVLNMHLNFYLQKNAQRFDKRMSFQKFKEVFTEIMLETFGHLQTKKEIKAVTGIHPERLSSLIERKIIGTYRISNMYEMVDVADVGEYLAERYYKKIFGGR